ncbi:MAG: RHS repeat protein [Propionibacteriaceae bacterium]|nr:RHS repeat protein [Propionibacteriaceae bacterium]
MEDHTGESTYEYDELGRLTRVTQASGRAVTYTYTCDGYINEIGYPDGSHGVMTRFSQHLVECSGMGSLIVWHNRQHETNMTHRGANVRLGGYFDTSLKKCKITLSGKGYTCQTRGQSSSQHVM